jgi:integrase
MESKESKESPKMNRTEILKLILNRKDDISDSSARIYVASLLSLSNHFEWTDVRNFTNKSKDILKYLDTLTPQRAKAILSSLLAIVSHKKVSEIYKNKMLDVAKTVRDTEQKQEKTEKQSENWESWASVLNVYKDLESEASPLFNKSNLSPQNLKTILHYVILSMYVLIPPRRIADYTNFKIKDISKKDDNYLDQDKNELVFNAYKTAKNYGTQRVECPPKLLEVLNKWIPVASKYSDFLLFNSYGNGLSQPQLTKMLNAIFDKKISASMLRHIFVSEVTLKDAPKLSELEKVAHDMGQSVAQQQLYKKF